MSSEPADAIAALLRRHQAGDASAGEELMRALYGELHDLARRKMARQQPWHTLQATALVNEALLRVLRGDERTFQDRDHVLALAARAMRSVLVDHARQRTRKKRGGDAPRPLSLDDVAERYEERAVDLVALDESLQQLSQVEPALAELVELHFFGRLSLREIARLRAVAPHVVEREWRMAKAWLRMRLQ